VGREAAVKIAREARMPGEPAREESPGEMGHGGPRGARVRRRCGTAAPAEAPRCGRMKAKICGVRLWRQRRGDRVKGRGEPRVCAGLGWGPPRPRQGPLAPPTPPRTTTLSPAAASRHAQPQPQPHPPNHPQLPPPPLCTSPLNPN
jgi:hypothetical protein